MARLPADKPTILVIGDLMLDRYTWGDAERVSPEAPVIVLRSDQEEIRPGGAASVAYLLKHLDANVLIAGVIGNDSDGQTLRALLRDEGLSDRFVLTDPNRPTTVKHRFVGRASDRHPHQILRVDRESRAPLPPELDREFLRFLQRDWFSNSAPHIPTPPHSTLQGGNFGDQTLQALEALEPQRRGDQPGQTLENQTSSPCQTSSACHTSSPCHASRQRPLDAILISDYLKGVCSERLLQQVITAARADGIPVLVDPGRTADYHRYAGATLLKPNRIEAELANSPPLNSSSATAAKISTPRDALVAAQALRTVYQVDSVIITLDRDGLVLATPDSEHEIATTPRTVYDITGAGDMVLATLGLCLATGMSILEAAELANIAAGLEVERFGVAPVKRHEILAKSHPPAARVRTLSSESSEITSQTPSRTSKLVTSTEITELCQKYRQQGKTIVFTNGCFDLLHVGHVTSLQYAATLGDILIVAVNSDASVCRLKGPTRPIIPEQDRATLLAALSCVDHVVIFHEDTPETLLQQIRPDILVKGGTTTQITGQNLVESYGGAVYRTAEVNGVSTTELISYCKSRSETSQPLPPQGFNEDVVPAFTSAE